MDTTQLEAAYRSLLTLVESIPDTTRYPPAAREDIDWALSHISLSDRSSPLQPAISSTVVQGSSTTGTRWMRPVSPNSSRQPVTSTAS